MGFGAWGSSKCAKAGSIPKEAPLMLEGLMESSLKLGGPDCSLDSFHVPGEEKNVYDPPASSIPSYVNLDWWKTLGFFEREGII